MKPVWGIITGVALTLAFGISAAQTEYAPQSLGACGADIGSQCQGIKNGGGRILRCLKDHAATLSAPCKAAALTPPSDFPADTKSGVAITVTVTGVRSDKGFVWVALTDDASAFPRGRRMVVLPAHPGTLTATFSHLKPNRYAIFTYHDENDSGSLDYGAGGIPSEGSAFSNGTTGIPNFEASAIQVSGDSKVTLKLVYP